MVDQTIQYFNSTMAEAAGVEQIARGAYSSAFFSNPGETVLGLFMCATMLVTAFYISHRYTVGEREELAEAERRRVEEEKEKEQQIETYRSKIAKIIESYAIHLTNITSRSPLSRSNHDSAAISSNLDSTRQIPKGNEDEDRVIDTISITSDSSQEDVVDIEAISTDDGHNEVVTDGLLPTAGETTCTIIRPTVIDDAEDQIQDEESLTSRPLSLSKKSTAFSISLREAVTDNPCSICLEPFRPGDAIVCCSNNVNGQKPHVFHKACSYDYIINHSEGIQAPCPMCRKLLLPPEDQRQGCFKDSHSLELTLPREDESDTIEGSEDSKTESAN